ncbi:GNAT family N-acetyltransferase [Veronia pacifica]|uniref:Acetyltransferase n=1 Tax=Veronia pacifica TaxID=1080227 RepID=A0A1C3EL41_9GAMM|nr:GNAT family N-acetyltransferase [Veronia pacifica]ODA33949.1 acetyltransferase [Veronia pacifica]
MEIVHEITLTKEQHESIKLLRNQSFPDHQSDYSYFKQRPHMRALQYEGDNLIGYLGLDYRAVKVGDEVYNVLGIIDFCVDQRYRGKGIGSLMLSDVSAFAEGTDVDFIILISELGRFYEQRGYTKVESLHSWLRIHQHTNYGVAVDHVDELFVKPVSGKSWSAGHVDWLGYMY